jgi:hypothetical protein
MLQNQGVDFYEIGDALARAQIPVDAADCHGLLAGLVCAAGFADPAIWMAQVFDDYNPKDGVQADAARRIQALYEDTLARLNSPEMDFSLLLPDDHDSLRERTESLGSWCGGFLSGLGLGGVADASQLPEAVGEMLDDLAQIARVDFELEEADEAEQAAFEEVVEYVRVGVLFINEELQPSKAPPRLQ